MSTTTPSSIPTATPSVLADWIRHTSLSSACPPRHISNVETLINNIFSCYTCLTALLLPLTILIFFFTPPDRDFRPQEVDDMSVEEDSLEEEDTERNDGSSDACSMEGEVGSSSDCASGSHGAGPGSSSSPNTHSDSGSESCPSSPSDREWDGSTEEWTEAEQQQSAASCCPQYTAWARDLNPEDID